VKRFRGGLVCKAHRRLYHSTLGLSVIKKKKRILGFGVWGFGVGRHPPMRPSVIPSPDEPKSAGGPVFKAHRLLYHSTLGLRVIKKKKKSLPREAISGRISVVVLCPTCLLLYYSQA